jgi:hypothetical protein
VLQWYDLDASRFTLGVPLLPASPDVGSARPHSVELATAGHPETCHPQTDHTGHRGTKTNPGNSELTRRTAGACPASSPRSPGWWSRSCGWSCRTPLPVRAAWSQSATWCGGARGTLSGAVLWQGEGCDQLEVPHLVRLALLPVLEVRQAPLVLFLLLSELALDAVDHLGHLGLLLTAGLILHPATQ